MLALPRSPPSCRLHFAAEERIATILRRLGKPEAAKFVEGILPTSKSIRSGDLGEILATEWIAAQSGYEVAIKRLRWKDLARPCAATTLSVSARTRKPGVCCSSRAKQKAA
jgi:hypothetical protein